MRLRVGLIGGVLLALACAAPALAGTAAIRYAEPGGDGASPCTMADPCEIEDAVETVASPGDEVVLLPGTYALGGDAIEIADNIDVTGMGAPSEVVLQSTADIPVHIAFSSTSSTLANVTIDHDTASVVTTIGLQVEGGTAERVFVDSTGGNYACYTSGLIRDSVCVNTSASGGVGAGLFSPVDLTGTLRNVTAVAMSSSGHGLFMAATLAGADLVLDGRNVIAMGNTGIGGTGVPGSTAQLNLAFSNFPDVEFGDFTGTATGTLNTVNDNQGAPPLLDAEYRQMPGSPTIDAGDDGATLLGALDIDLDDRVQGDGVDIGADEADGEVPDTEITKKPRKRTRQRTARFLFESPDQDASGFDCKLDSKPYKPCNSGAVRYTNLKRKRHTFKVRAKDGFNVDPTPATHSWRVKKRR